MRKALSAILLSLLLCGSGVAMGAPANNAGDGAAVTATATAKPNKDALKKLRGKLLYKRNQIRKMENNAVSKDSVLRGKVADLENQRQKLYVEAEPKLSELYAAELDLKNQIDAMSPKK